MSNHAPLRRSSHLTTLLTTGIAERRWYIISMQHRWYDTDRGKQELIQLTQDFQHTYTMSFRARFGLARGHIQGVITGVC